MAGETEKWPVITGHQMLFAALLLSQFNQGKTFYETTSWKKGINHLSCKKYLAISSNLRKITQYFLSITYIFVRGQPISYIKSDFWIIHLAKFRKAILKISENSLESIQSGVYLKFGLSASKQNSFYFL